MKVEDTLWCGHSRDNYYFFPGGFIDKHRCKLCDDIKAAAIGTLPIVVDVVDDWEPPEFPDVEDPII